MLERKVVWESYHWDRMKKDKREEILEKVDYDELGEEEQAAYDHLEQMPVVISTPMGDILKDDSMNLLDRIEHRICHTNFTISEKEATFVNFVEGVETLTVISRYQMIVGFGRLFDGALVRKEISEGLIDIDSYSDELFLKHKAILDRAQSIQL